MKRKDKQSESFVHTFSLLYYSLTQQSTSIVSCLVRTRLELAAPRFWHRSFVIQFTDAQGTTRTYQRDASMISLIPPTEIKSDPSDPNLIEKAPHAHQSIALSPVEEGEYVILKDTKDSKTWYCAQVLEKLPDRIKVNYHTTSISALPKYGKATHAKRLQRLQELIFLRTWTSSTGEATTIYWSCSIQKEK